MKAIATARAVLCVALGLGAAAATACSSDPRGSEVQHVGTVTIPLLAEVGGHTYRLDAVFLITGGPAPVTLATSGNENVLSTTLPTGSYLATVESFALSKDDGTGAFRPVVATLVSNAQAFSILPQASTTISFQFETDGVIVASGTGNLNITFGVTEVPPACDPITVDPQERTVRSARFFLDFSNLVAGNPEELDRLQWAGGSNLVESFASDACTSGVVEHFGNSWAPPDPGRGGQVLVGSGSTGSWEQDGASILIRSTSSGCAASASVPVETRYRFRDGLGADTIEVERQFDLASAALNRAFRPFMPRLTVAFDQVLHPSAAGTALLAEDVFDCPYGCQRANWDGTWFAYYASAGPFAGQGMIVLREPSATPAALWIDNDAGITNTNTSSVLLVPPAEGFPATVSEKELLCFFDADSWSPAEQAGLTLPAGCTLDLACDAGGGTDAGGCAIGPYADGDVWDRTYDFQQWYLVPFTVGPNQRLYSGFYRGYAFSDDDGKTWTVKDLSAQIPAGSPWPEPSVGGNGGSIWLYVAGEGVLHSSDGGISFSWVPALSGMGPFSEGWVTVSPYDDRHLLAYAASEDAFGSLRGTVYRSVDAGATWANLDGALALAGADDTHSVAFDPATLDHFWVAGMPEGVFETNDGGDTFVPVPGSTHDFLSGVTRTFDGTNDRLVVTGACSPPTSAVIGTDMWQASTGDAPHCCPWPAVVADPFDPAVAVAYQCHDNVDDNLRYSTDGALNLSRASWPGSLDTSGAQVRSVHVDAYHRGTFYATRANDWTLLKSTDGGVTWSAVGWLPGHGC